ncbi:hypothetical protein [Duganella sp. S19_KUP01_CR8]|uniref:hypothetical protein n=1 Tax=Duganella sp. S19_KUP01_CR8 TaxID=3025502 RepID=UPI002FCD866F
MDTVENSSVQLDSGGLVKILYAQSAESSKTDTIALWRRLAAELVAIIGRNDFDSLYARTIHLVRMQHPWLVEGRDQTFDHLQTSLEGQEQATAYIASVALLTTFTNVLTQLIGERLTTAILKSAWSQETADTSAKEINNE